jgi:hypothetical protein
MAIFTMNLTESLLDTDNITSCPNRLEEWSQL